MGFIPCRLFVLFIVLKSQKVVFFSCLEEGPNALRELVFRLLADIVSYPKSYFEILTQIGKKLFFIKNEGADARSISQKLKK